ncbi:unnamed protein product [Oikopleura dioica]|uniref:Uncharacterized protein n=1 Tax=Oikopleura dioica TaxID=34765 RepID=E4X5D9_OIKDI|nr:unnamed protein product [Oikopleura dioica]
MLIVVNVFNRLAGENRCSLHILLENLRNEAFSNSPTRAFKGRNRQLHSGVSYTRSRLHRSEC